MSNTLSAGDILGRLERGATALARLPFDVIADVPRILRHDPSQPPRAAQRFGRAASDVVSLPFEIAGRAADRLGLTTAGASARWGLLGRVHRPVSGGGVQGGANVTAAGLPGVLFSPSPLQDILDAGGDPFSETLD